ncbi:MATE family efflux transporter [Clostridium oceanicum]|uniref:Multidrug export protein MepA n=1 Tax=Clostridium oceanicum TaxID=1543 RepID=A0ABN1J953_9CLOT
MSTTNKNIKIMSEEKISKALLKLGLPVIIGMLVTAFNNVIDAMFVGGLGTSQIAAVSVTFPISQLIIGIGLIFGCGAAPYVSRFLGEKNIKKANEISSTAFFNSLLCGIILVILTLIFIDKILILFGATSTILPYAKKYAIIFVSGSILNIINVTLNNITTAEGASKISMSAMLISGVLNIILDPIFIYSLNLGIKGAATATVIAQSITTILYIIYLLKGKNSLKISYQNFSFNKKIHFPILKVGFVSFFFQLLVSISIGLLNSKASIYGDYAVASMGIVTRITTFVSYVVFGYSKGFQAIVGYNYGAKNWSRFKETINISLKWTTIFCIIITILLITFSSPVISIFSKDYKVINLSIKALKANIIMFIFFGFQCIYTTLFVAIGKIKEGGILGIARQGIFFIPTIFILPHIVGINGIVFTQAVADLLATILTAILAIKLNKSFNFSF